MYAPDSQTPAPEILVPQLPNKEEAEEPGQTAHVVIMCCLLWPRN